MAIMLLACANMVLRFLGYPLQGTFEILGFGGAFIAALALGGTQLKKGHIQVDIFYLGSGLASIVVQVLGKLACILFFSLLALQMFKLGWLIKQSGELSETLHIIYYPVVFAVGLGFVLLVLVLLLQLAHELGQGENP